MKYPKYSKPSDFQVGAKLLATGAYNPVCEDCDESEGNNPENWRVKSKAYHFVFCHGWGFDHSFFDPLYLKLSEYEMTIWDMGYFGDKVQAAPPTDVTLIGVGHSFGLIQLINSQLPFHALIGLQGFVDFFGQQPALKWFRKKAWEKLCAEFEHSPESTLKRFYEQCQAPAPARFSDFQADILLAELKNLGTIVSPPDGSLLILGASGDKIVPPSLIEDNFGSLLEVKVEDPDADDSKTRHLWLDFYHPDKKRSFHHHHQASLKQYHLLDVPGHNLGWAHADWVVNQIKTILI